MAPAGYPLLRLSRKAVRLWSYFQLPLVAETTPGSHLYGMRGNRCYPWRRRLLTIVR